MVWKYWKVMVIEWHQNCTFSYLGQCWTLQGLCLRIFIWRSSYPGIMLWTVLRIECRAEKTPKGHVHCHHALLSILRAVYISEFQRGIQNPDRNERREKLMAQQSPTCLKGISYLQNHLPFCLHQRDAQAHSPGTPWPTLPSHQCRPMLTCLGGHPNTYIQPNIVFSTLGIWHLYHLSSKILFNIIKKISFPDTPLHIQTHPPNPTPTSTST